MSDILALTMATRHVQCSILVAGRSRFAMMHHDGMKIYQKEPPWYVYVETRNGISTDQGALEYAVNHGKRNPGHGKWPIHVTAPPNSTKPSTSPRRPTAQSHPRHRAARQHKAVVRPSNRNINPTI